MLVTVDTANSNQVECHRALTNALQTAYRVLENNGSCVDAVETAIKIMEDFPLFNAGRGAVLNNLGKCELDASIMDGKTKNAGAIGGITTVKNPISLARAVMEKTTHVFIIGESANNFAQEQNLEIVEPSYFITDLNIERLKKAQTAASSTPENKIGTVGAVALDKNGNLAAGTSTGGSVNKHHGRIGDSAIIGAGTYADNNTCAISCTGLGEIFMRNVSAYDIAALMEYKNLSVEQAANIIIKTKQEANTGGVIALDKSGNYAMPFNTAGMLRGYITENGQSKTYIYD
jgi:beta-aspartyl-peptidase (threonine type)